MLKKLRDRLNGINKRLNEIHKLAEDDDRTLNAEERAEWDRLVAEHSDLETRIKDAERINRNPISDALGDDLEQAFNEESRDRDDRESLNRPITQAERSAVLTAWFGSAGNISPAARQLATRMGWDLNSKSIDLRIDRGCDSNGRRFKPARTIKELEDQYRSRREQSNEHRWINPFGETRAQAVGTAGAGGNTVPDEMMGPLERALLAFGGMRQVSTVISTSTGADMPWPTVNDTSNEGAILAENTVITEQDAVFGQVVFKSYKYTSKLVRVSLEMIQDSSIDVPSFLGSALGERLARILNRHFTVGTGTGEPQGVVVGAANSGVTAASNTALTFDEVLNLKHSVDPEYRMGASWMGHDDVLLMLKLMKDSQNRPLWLPSLIPGEPSTFDGDPFVVNQHMATGASAKALLYGDFSKYYIRDTTSIGITRLDERYADFLQVAWFGWGRWDGRLIDAGTGPVKYLTLAA